MNITELELFDIVRFREQSLDLYLVHDILRKTMIYYFYNMSTRETFYLADISIEVQRIGNLKENLKDLNDQILEYL